MSSSFLSEYPDQSPVIVTYISNDVYEVNKLCLAFKTMKCLGKDESEHPASLLVFNEDDLIVEQKALQISKEFSSLIREAVSSSKSSEILRTSHKQFAQVKTISFFL